MQPLADKPIDVFAVFDAAFKRTIPVLKETFATIILLTLAQAFIIYIAPLSTSHYFNLIVEVVGFIFFLYLCGVLVYQADQLFIDRPVTLQQACQTVLRRSPGYFAIIILIAAIIVGYYLLMAHVFRQPAGTRNNADMAIHGMLFALVGLMPILLFVVFELFAIPLVLLRKVSVLKSLLHSYQLVGMRWLPAFSAYAMIGIVFVLVTPTTQHAHFFLRYHLLILFNFAIFCLLAPFVASYILIMLHDFETRYRFMLREVSGK